MAQSVELSPFRLFYCYADCLALNQARPCSFLAQSVELSPFRLFYYYADCSALNQARPGSFLAQSVELSPFRLFYYYADCSALNQARPCSFLAQSVELSPIFYLRIERGEDRDARSVWDFLLSERQSWVPPYNTPTGSVFPSRLERAEARMRGVSGIFYCPRDRVGSRLTIHRQALCFPRAWKGLRLGCEECLGFSTVRETELGPALQYTDRLCVSLAPGKG